MTAVTKSSEVPSPVSWDPVRDGWDPEDPNRRCWTCGRSLTGRFADGSPSYDHGHHPDGTVWEADPDDGFDPDRSVPPNERSLPGIARYAIVALERGDIAPHELATLTRQWRRSRSRSKGSPPGRGHGMGEVRTCPACQHDHAVGTTCARCEACQAHDLMPQAEDTFGDLLPGGAAARAARARHEERVRRQGGCDMRCGVPFCRGRHIDEVALARFLGGEDGDDPADAPTRPNGAGTSDGRDR